MIANGMEIELPGDHLVWEFCSPPTVFCSHFIYEFNQISIYILQTKIYFLTNLYLYWRDWWLLFIPNSYYTIQNEKCKSSNLFYLNWLIRSKKELYPFRRTIIDWLEKIKIGWRIGNPGFFDLIWFSLGWIGLNPILVPFFVNEISLLERKL